MAARKERERRAAIEALAGEAIEDSGAEYNPFLEEGAPRGDDDAAGLALAATIAGGGPDDEADFVNPFLTPDDADSEPAPTGGADAGSLPESVAEEAETTAES